MILESRVEAGTPSFVAVPLRLEDSHSAFRECCLDQLALTAADDQLDDVCSFISPSPNTESHRKCNFGNATIRSTRQCRTCDNLFVSFTDFSLKNLQSRDCSRVIHSRRKAGQFLNSMPLSSQAARNVTTSRSTSVTSTRSSIAPRHSSPSNSLIVSTCSS
jgi:hypothetical protein